MAQPVLPLLTMGLCISAPASARTIPLIDTEEATLSSSVVGGGWVHPTIGIDLRNGDFARGNYDDDAANLQRLPAHVALGIDVDVHHRADGSTDAWFVATTNNGFHSPKPYERVSPRPWYESNNLVAVVVEPAAGFRAAAIYTVKTSPNGVSGVSNEASLSLRYDTKRGLGRLHPTFAITAHPVQGHGLYTLAGIEPEVPLGSGEDAVKLSLPAQLGVGWRGFYQPGSGDRLFGDVGLGLSRRVRVGGVPLKAHADILAGIRDDRLRVLSAPRGETSTVIPLAAIGFSFAY